MHKQIFNSTLYRHREFNKWLGFAMSAILVVFTIWSSNSIVQKLKLQEQKKMETIVKAIELQGNALNISDEARALSLKITEDNTSMPMILVDEVGMISDVRNLGNEEKKLLEDSLYLKSKLIEMSNQHPPIEVELPFGTQKIYYENSSLLSQLQYFPVVLILIILLFTAFSIWYFRTLNESQKSFLWAGMAKETAHQIGTPLSSLMGWVELLRLEKIDESILEEMDNDIKRLQQIAERFSKIGSVPKLQKENLSELVEKAYNYLKPRISEGIDFQLRIKSDNILANCNAELMGWVLENLVKNAVDALQNRGKIELKIEKKGSKAIISISDSGTGIPISLQRQIFEPGYTTKKRGWGLGLSLAKRIINEYHNGKIYVLSSDKQHGTVINIEIKTIK